MPETIIFALTENGKTTYRLIANQNGTIEEQTRNTSGQTVTNLFTRHQLVEMAKAILAWNGTQSTTF